MRIRYANGQYANIQYTIYANIQYTIHEYIYVCMYVYDSLYYDD